ERVYGDDWDAYGQTMSDVTTTFGYEENQPARPRATDPTPELATLGCVDAGWVDTPDERFQPLEQWSLAGHLIYGRDAGFHVRSLTYEEGTAYTTEIMNLAVKELVPVVGVRFLDLTVGAGSIGVDGEVLPTFSLQVQCPGRHAELLAALLGKSLNLNNVQVVK